MIVLPLVGKSIVFADVVGCAEVTWVGAACGAVAFVDSVFGAACVELDAGAEGVHAAMKTSITAAATR